MKKTLIILGIRGVPAKHGGFETFAEYLCKFLVHNGWNIIVYCQEDGSGPIYESEWLGVRRIHIPVNKTGPLGTILFDFRSIVHSLKHKGLYLTLGYNTAIFNILHRILFKTNIINMDGIEWKRQKWGNIAKSWFWLNERFGCWFGNHLIADHPKIKEHLATRVSESKITMIPYGAVDVGNADVSFLSRYNLTPNKYSIVIARPEPENSIYEIVKSFSESNIGDEKLVVLGSFNNDNSYHNKIKSVASENVIFPGAIYDHEVVSSLRYFSRYYFHGHQVGGTNPSLVEALGAGCAIIAHNNKFNQWVASDGAIYFDDENSLKNLIKDSYLNEDEIEKMKIASKDRFKSKFKWDIILSDYEKLFIKYLK